MYFNMAGVVRIKHDIVKTVGAGAKAQSRLIRADGSTILATYENDTTSTTTQSSDVNVVAGDTIYLQKYNSMTNAGTQVENFRAYYDVVATSTYGTATD